MVFGLRDKVMIGVGLTFLLLNLTLLPIVFTGAVPDAVDEKFETYPLDAACGEDGDCSTVEANWATSTAQRDYYAWDVTNLADVMATGATPTYQKMGPFTYDITSTKTLIDSFNINLFTPYILMRDYKRRIKAGFFYSFGARAERFSGCCWTHIADDDTKFHSSSPFPS